MNFFYPKVNKHMQFYPSLPPLSLLCAAVLWGESRGERGDIFTHWGQETSKQPHYVSQFSNLKTSAQKTTNIALIAVRWDDSSDKTCGL